MPEECEFWRAGGIRLTGEVLNYYNRGKKIQPYRREDFFQILFFPAVQGSAGEQDCRRVKACID